MSKTPQLSLLDAEEQRFYSKPHPDLWGPRPISKPKPSLPAKEIHVDNLILSVLPQLMTIGQVWNIDWLIPAANHPSFSWRSLFDETNRTTSSATEQWQNPKAKKTEILHLAARRNSIHKFMFLHHLYNPVICILATCGFIICILHLNKC